MSRASASRSSAAGPSSAARGARSTVSNGKNRLQQQNVFGNFSDSEEEELNDEDKMWRKPEGFPDLSSDSGNDSEDMIPSIPKRRRGGTPGSASRLRTGSGAAAPRRSSVPGGGGGSSGAAGQRRTSAPGGGSASHAGPAAPRRQESAAAGGGSGSGATGPRPAEPAGGGRASSSGSGASADRSFGAIGGAPSPGMEGPMTILLDASSKSEVILGHLRSVMPPSRLAGLAGMLLSATMPEHVTELVTGAGGNSATLKRLPQPGCGPGKRGFAVGCMVIFSWAMVGAHKTKFSSGAAGTTENHPFFASMRSMCEGGVDTAFMPWVARALAPARSEMHADTRAGLAKEIIEPLLRRTYTSLDNLIGVDHVNELFREARTRVDLINEKDEPVDTFLNAMMERPMKQHNGREGQYMPQDVLGGHMLHKDFLHQVLVPLTIHALADIEHMMVGGLGGRENHLGLALRKTAAWSKLQNGGFATRAARSFQDQLWYRLFIFVTGTRRSAHPLVNMPEHTFNIHFDAAEYITPYLMPGKSTVGIINGAAGASGASGARGAAGATGVAAGATGGAAGATGGAAGATDRVEETPAAEAVAFEQQH